MDVDLVDNGESGDKERIFCNRIVSLVAFSMLASLPLAPVPAAVAIAPADDVDDSNRKKWPLPAPVLH